VNYQRDVLLNVLERLAKSVAGDAAADGKELGDKIVALAPDGQRIRLALWMGRRVQTVNLLSPGNPDSFDRARE
jgi:hypothetical protein